MLGEEGRGRKRVTKGKEGGEAGKGGNKRREEEGEKLKKK